MSETSTKTTTALILHEINGPFSLGTVKLNPLRSDEALVEIHATGICHTDLSCAAGILPANAPAVFGHEAVIRRTVYDFAMLNFGGKRVDGSSAMVLGQSENTIDEKTLHSSFFGQSSFSRLAVVNKSSLVKVPQDTNLELFAPLGCGIQTGAGAVLNVLDVKPGATLAVFGVGSVGMSAIMAAKIRGAKEIIAIDLQPARLELAKKLGATYGILGSDPDVVQLIQERCPPNGVNFALDCSGVPAVVEKMVDSLGTRGKAASVGAPAPGKKAAVDIFSHLVLGREYVGCCEGDCVPSDIIPYLMDQHAKGNFPLEELITTYDVKDFAKAISDTEKGKSLKAVLKWS